MSSRGRNWLPWQGESPALLEALSFRPSTTWEHHRCHCSHWECSIDDGAKLWCLSSLSLLPTPSSLFSLTAGAIEQLVMHSCLGFPVHSPTQHITEWCSALSLFPTFCLMRNSLICSEYNKCFKQRRKKMKKTGPRGQPADIHVHTHTHTQP